MTMPVRLQRLWAKLSPQQWLTRFRRFSHHRTEIIARAQDDCDWDLLRYLVPAGTHVVDVGASLGGSTRALAELVGESGRITSIEPLPMLHSLLVDNLRKLGLQQVELLRLAVSSQVGQGRLLVPEPENGGSEHWQQGRLGVMPGPGEMSIEVPTRTLDSLFQYARPAIDMVRLDVADHVLHCLRGAAELLRKTKPIWWLRVEHAPDDPFGPMCEVFHLLERRGYRGYCFNGAAVQRWQADDGERGRFALFLTARHLRRLADSQCPYPVIDTMDATDLPSSPLAKAS